jgi:hypothetical protein
MIESVTLEICASVTADPPRREGVVDVKRPAPTHGMSVQLVPALLDGKEQSSLIFVQGLEKLRRC